MRKVAFNYLNLHSAYVFRLSMKWSQGMRDTPGIQKSRKELQENDDSGLIYSGNICEKASFTATPATSMLWGDPDLMFNVKKSLFSSGSSA